MGLGTPRLDSWVLEVCKGPKSGVFASLGKSTRGLKCQSRSCPKPSGSYSQIQNSLFGPPQASCSQDLTLGYLRIKRGRGWGLNLWFLRVWELKAKTTQRRGADTSGLGVPPDYAGAVQRAGPSEDPSSLRVGPEVPGRGGQIELMAAQDALVGYCERLAGQPGVLRPRD